MIDTRPTEYELPTLTYGYKDLEPHYSADLLELHHSKHHAGYVKGTNNTLTKLWEARAGRDYDSLNQLQKNLAFNLSGHILHSMFWKNMSPDGGGAPPEGLAQALTQSFEDIDLFREQFNHAALSIQGSGWAALSWEPLSQSLVVEQIYDHQGNCGNGTVPVLVLDMWEHAFYLQYRTEKKEWVDAFWELVNWHDVDARVAKVSKLDLHL